MQQINITFDPDRSKESYKRFFRYERQQELKRMPIKLIILICCSLIALGLIMEVKLLWTIGLINVAVITEAKCPDH